MAKKQPLNLDKLPLHFNVKTNPYVEKVLEASVGQKLPIRLRTQLSTSAQLECFFAEQQESSSQKKKKFIIEIGCHNGTSLSQMAQAFPEINFIGLDITFKRVYLAAERAAQLGLKNVLVMPINALEIFELFNDLSCYGIICFYPDPWNKKRSQIHNRLLQKDFLIKTTAFLAEGGFFWLKTDQQDYFQEVNIHLSELLIDPVGSFPVAEKAYSSVFEKKFRRLGLSSYEKYWEKPSSRV